MERVVIDTNIFVSAVMSPAGAPRQVLRLALSREILPLMGNTLFCELEDVLARDELFKGAPLTREERGQLFDAFSSVCVWIPVYYLWRPNLPDESDNHVLELAVAGRANAVITANKRDFERGEMRFPSIRIVNAGEFMKERHKT